MILVFGLFILSNDLLKQSKSTNEYEGIITPWISKVPCLDLLPPARIRPIPKEIILKETLISPA